MKKMIIKKFKDTLFDLVVGKSLNCNELNRDKWVERQLSLVPAGRKIIDIGAGECRYKKYCSHLEYISQDFCQYNGKNMDVGLQTGTWDTSKIDIVSDITKIPVDGASFDVILCTEVFEHIPHPDQALMEFNRIIKKGGLLILSAPFASLTHFAPYHFFSGFNSYWYKTVLDEYGWEVKKCLPNGNYYSLINQEIDRIIRNMSGYKDLRMLIGGRLVKSYLRHRIRNEHDCFGLACFGYHVVAVKR